MGLSYRYRKRVGRSTLNLSKSGPSLSRRVGRLTVNSRGRGTVRIAKGLSFKFKFWR